MTFSLLITDSPENGLFSWHLRDGAMEAQGFASTIERCLTAVAWARIELDSRRRDPYPSWSAINPHPGLDHTIAQVQTAKGDTLPAQQKIPPPNWLHADPTVRYDHRPSGSG